jgi:hypothetical protein
MRKFITPVVTFVAMVAAILLNACTEPLTDTATPEVAQTEANAPAPIEFSPEELSLVEQIANNSPKISQESAQQTAMQLLGLQGDASEVNSTPAKPLLASTVFCNRKTVYNGISKSYETENDTAFYVFNTPDDNGFAIVAADLRVPNQVLAYADDGNFDVSSEHPASAFFLDLAKDYVAYCIEKAEEQKDSLLESICSKLGIESDTVTQPKIRSKYSSYRIRCTNVASPVITVTDEAEVKPKISTHWGQGYPFNLKNEGKSVGCAPVAVSQLLAFWHYPGPINGYIPNWSIIFSPSSKYYEDAVSSLIQNVRKELNTKGTSTNKHTVLNYFRRIHLSNQNQYYDYKKYKVTDALDNGMPVLMRGERKKNSVKKRHQWIVDGYLKRWVVKEELIKYCIVEQFDDGTVKTRYEDIPLRTSKYYELLHINWGWDGDGDGYYTEGIFDTYREMQKDDEGFFYETTTTPRERTNYTYDLEIIADIKLK